MNHAADSAEHRSKNWRFVRTLRREKWRKGYECQDYEPTTHHSYHNPSNKIIDFVKKRAKSNKEQQQCELEEERERRGNREDLPPLQSDFAKKSKFKTFFRIARIVSYKLANPLLDEDTKRRSDKGDWKTKGPQCVDQKRSSSSRERSGRVGWKSRIDESSVERKAP